MKTLTTKEAREVVAILDEAIEHLAEDKGWGLCAALQPAPGWALVSIRGRGLRSRLLRYLKHEAGADAEVWDSHTYSAVLGSPYFYAGSTNRADLCRRVRDRVAAALRERR